MLKKTITYTDYDGTERTEDFYFNLSKGEVFEMELSTVGGLQGLGEKLIATRNQKELVSIFKELILKSYGVKSSDGRRFIKSQELRDDFEQTEAYSELFTELVLDTQEAIRFFNGVSPELTEKDIALIEKQKKLQEEEQQKKLQEGTSPVQADA